MEPHIPNSVRDRLLFLVDPAVTSLAEKNKDDAGGFRTTSMPFDHFQNSLIHTEFDDGIKITRLNKEFPF